MSTPEDLVGHGQVDLVVDVHDLAWLGRHRAMVAPQERVRVVGFCRSRIEARSPHDDHAPVGHEGGAPGLAGDTPRRRVSRPAKAAPDPLRRLGRSTAGGTSRPPRSSARYRSRIRGIRRAPGRSDRPGGSARWRTTSRSPNRSERPRAHRLAGARLALPRPRLPCRWPGPRAGASARSPLVWPVWRSPHRRSRHPPCRRPPSPARARTSTRRRAFRQQTRGSCPAGPCCQPVPG